MTAMLPLLRRFAAPLTCAVLLLLPHTSQGETWKEVRSPHFRVITDGLPSQARDVAVEFEQMRHLFTLLFHRDDVDAPAPLTIFAAADGGSMDEIDRSLLKRDDGRLAGMYIAGWQKQFALVRLNALVYKNQVIVFHDYAFGVLKNNWPWLPVWLKNGMVEFYTNTRFEKGYAVVGEPSIHLLELRAGTLIPMASMLTLNPGIAFRHDPEQEQVYEEEAWAIVHFMEFDTSMGNGTKLMEFVELLEHHVPDDEAFSQVFGNPTAFDRMLLQYVNNLNYKTAKVADDPRIDARTFTERKLSPAEADFEIGSFRAALKDRDGARIMMERALALDPKMADAHEELGFLDFEGGEDKDARREWQQAIALNPNLPYSMFALAMTTTPLNKQSPPELLATQSELLKVTQAAPRFAAPFADLALVEWYRGYLQQAIHDALIAEDLEPSRAGYRILAGEIFLRGNKPELAAAEARYVAAHWSGPADNEAVDLFNAVPPADRGNRPAPVYEFPSRSEIMRGTLMSVNCSVSGQVSSLTLLPAGRGAAPLTLSVSKDVLIGYSDTFWWGHDHFSPCHQLSGATAILATQTVNSADRVVEIDVRDSRPKGPGDGQSHQAGLVPDTAASAGTAAGSDATTALDKGPRP